MPKSTVLVPDNRRIPVQLAWAPGHDQSFGISEGQGHYIKFGGSARYNLTFEGDLVVISLLVSAYLRECHQDGSPREDFTSCEKDVSIEMGRIAKTSFYGFENLTIGEFDTIGHIADLIEGAGTDKRQYSSAHRKEYCTVNQVVKQWDFYTFGGQIDVFLWPLNILVKE